MQLAISPNNYGTFVERRSGSEMERLILDIRLQEVGVAPKEGIKRF